MLSIRGTSLSVRGAEAEFKAWRAAKLSAWAAREEFVERRGGSRIVLGQYTILLLSSICSRFSNSGDPRAVEVLMWSLVVTGIWANSWAAIFSLFF